MPYTETYVEREIVLVHNGVTVYHAYKEGWFEDRLFYWFSLSRDDDAEEFDVRELRAHQSDDIATTLRSAIDAGLLKNPEGEAA